MPNFLITGAGSRVGKTMVGCALAFAFKVRAMRVGVMKPVQTGCAERNGVLEAADATALIAAASSNLPSDSVCMYRYRSALPPAAAAEVDDAPLPDFARIERGYRELAAASDVMLVEDAGGLAAPIDWRRNYADLARALGLELILVAANRPDFINVASLALDYAARRGIVVRGFIVNALDRDAASTVQRDADLLARVTGARALGAVRFKEPLALSIVERLL